MANLFYSSNEKIAFWIVGYDYLYSEALVHKQIEYLQEKAKEMSSTCQIDLSAIKSSEIVTSRRYKYMRVFYVQTDNTPKDAFVLSKDWTMWKWLTN